MAYTHLDPGREIEVATRIYQSNQDRTAELVKLTLPELIAQEKVSVEQERAIFSKFSAIEAEWLKQAGETVAIRNAKQYLMVRPVEHTSNQWKKGQYDLYEMSNMVYKMSYRVYERTHYDRASQKSVTDAWELTWSIYYNTVRNPDHTGSGFKIAGQDRKRFTDRAEMDKYLQGRIKAYAHLFTEISPPIPEDQKGRFCVNGILLPGYTVKAPERTPQEVASDLLDFLEDGDMGEPEPPKPQVRAEPSAPKSSRQTAGKPPARKQKKHVPTR